MQKILSFAVMATVLVFINESEAAEQTVKLSVPGMNCASCPYMVKDAISMVDGIMSVDATMDDRSATVVFDDAVTTVGEIQEATSAIGYQSTIIQAE